MITLRAADLLRPRFFLGVLRQRLTAKAATITRRNVRVSIGSTIPPLLIPGNDILVRFLREDDFERNERELVTRTLASGDTFVDIGAHVGLYTVMAGHLVGETGVVVAVEPNPVTFATLEQNVAAHNLYEVVRRRQIAVSDEVGTASLNVPMPRLAAWTSLGTPSVGVARSFTVPTTTLDELLDGLKPFMLKLDVEGWERRVVAGGRHVLAGNDAPHLLVEFSETRAESSGTTTSSLAEDLSELGFELFYYDSGRGRLEHEPRGATYERMKNVVASKRVDELKARLARSA